jgi:hypothetical protein
MRRQTTPFASVETTGYTAWSLKALVAQQWLIGVSRRMPTLDLRTRQLANEHMKILQATHNCICTLICLFKILQNEWPDAMMSLMLVRKLPVMQTLLLVFLLSALRAICAPRNAIICDALALNDSSMSQDHNDLSFFSACNLPNHLTILKLVRPPISPPVFVLLNSWLPNRRTIIYPDSTASDCRQPCKYSTWSAPGCWHPQRLARVSSSFFNSQNLTHPSRATICCRPLA